MFMIYLEKYTISCFILVSSIPYILILLEISAEVSDNNSETNFVTRSKILQILSNASVFFIEFSR